MIKKWTILQFALMGLIGLIVMTQRVKADPVGLADWCVNLNGDTASVCNGGTATNSAAENTSAWDTTLEPGANTLGKIVVTIGTGAQYAGVYMDYDVDYPFLGSFEDAGVVNGAPSATQSYELNDPNSSNIFNDFASNALPDSNPVDPATCAANAPTNCDVAWALAESLNVNAALYSGGTVTFTVSTVKPTGGFYLQQTNEVTGGTIYMSDAVSLTPLGGPPAVPEPASVLLFATAAAGALLLKKRSSAKKA